MPYASLACDMTSASEVAVAAWGALQVLYAFAFALREFRNNKLRENAWLAVSTEIDANGT